MNTLQKLLESKSIAHLHNYIESLQLYSLDDDHRFLTLWQHPLCNKDEVLSYKDKNGNTILHLSQGNCFKIIEDIANHTNFDLNTVNQWSENIAFHIANRPSIIHLYKIFGVNVNHIDNLGRNMLFYKGYNSKPVILEGLKAGVNAQILTNDGFSLADHFCSQAYLTSFKKVCSKGSRLNNIIEDTLPEKHKIFYTKIKAQDIVKEKKKLLKALKLSESTHDEISKIKRL